ncbi:MAG: DctP family TRAP transporter solute-binding subunit [Rhodoferax sp.]
MCTAAALTRRHALQALAAAAWPCAHAAAPQGITIRLSHVVAHQTPKGLALQRFKERVQSLSEGRIQVVLYPNSVLYGDADEMQALQLGAVDMLAPSLSKFGRMGFPEFELFDLPFLFANSQEVRRVTDGPVGQQLLAGLTRQRMVGLGFLDNGFKHMSANKPLLEPPDFTGLRMRVQSSRVIAHQMRALGAQPVVLTFAETRRALATGVVDGTENPVSNFWTQRMHEVQTDLSLTQHGYLGYCLVVHQRFWDNLAEEDRELIQTALAQALHWGNAIAQHENDQALAALRASATTRIHTPASAQRERLRQAMQGVYLGLEGRIGRPWMEQVYAALRAPA